MHWTFFFFSEKKNLLQTNALDRKGRNVQNLTDANLKPTENLKGDTSWFQVGSRGQGQTLKATYTFKHLQICKQMLGG